MLQMQSHDPTLHSRPILVPSATRLECFADHVTKRNGGSGDENVLVPRGRAPFGQHHVTRYTLISLLEVSTPKGAWPLGTRMPSLGSRVFVYHPDL